MKDFVNSLIAHIKSLYDYLISVIKEKPLQVNYQLIRENEHWQRFERVFLGRHTGMNTAKVEELFIGNFERVETAWNETISAVARNTLGKINDISIDILKKL